MDVNTVMTKSPTTVGPDTQLSEVKRLFDTYKFHHLLVIDQGLVVGVISDRDLLKNLSPFLGAFDESARDTRTLTKRVHQIMSRTPTTIRRHADLYDAANLLLTNRLSCLPVVDDDGAAVGIVTWRDLLRWSMKNCMPGGHHEGDGGPGTAAA